MVGFPGVKLHGDRETANGMWRRIGPGGSPHKIYLLSRVKLLTSRQLRRMAVERVRDGEAAPVVIASYGFNRTTIYKDLRGN